MTGNFPFHELRHSCASLLIDMGFTLKDVQEWLGHSDIKMTANIYATSIPPGKAPWQIPLPEDSPQPNSRQAVEKW